MSEEEEGLALVSSIEQTGDPGEHFVAALDGTFAEVVEMKAAVHSAACDDWPQGREADSCERFITTR